MTVSTFDLPAPSHKRAGRRACRHLLSGVGAWFVLGCGAADEGRDVSPSVTAPIQMAPTAPSAMPPAPSTATPSPTTPVTPVPVVPPITPTAAIPPATPPSTPPPPASTPSSSSEPTSSTTPPEPAPSTSTEPTSSEPPTTNEPGNSQSAAELIASLGLGWNLGNSLDVPENETAWGNPTVDASLLTAVADAGFDIVRIPVTWSLFTGAAPNFTIDPARLARVEEVVGYVLDAGMYAIINLHHDGADEYDGVEWLTLTDANGNISEMVNSEVEARFRAVWTQIARHFADFDDRLIFESMNEIHDGYDAPDAGYYPIIDNLNQAFVDIVRDSGGNNATRKLVVPGYNTNIDYTLAGFTKPNDPAVDRLILSVHFYDPWSFAGEGSTKVWGTSSPGTDTWGQEDFVVGQFDKLKSTFIDRGLPVIMGEYGAINQMGYESYRRYYMEYVTQAACQRGILPIYWDNGGLGTGADSFGLFDRSSKEIAFPEILNAMFRACESTASLDSIAKP